jgi:patatin-like phospholipase domain-containing protein 2
MLNLSLSGCGFLGIYHIGVVSAFREHAPDIIKSKISGCSAGSLVAACALCDCCLGKSR